MESVFQRGDARVFIQKFGPRPDQKYAFLGCARMGAFTEPRGDVTALYCPDPQRRRKYVVVSKVHGAPDLPTTSLITRFKKYNVLRQLHCPFDIQAMYGACKDPQDREHGWEKILHYYQAELTQVAGEEMTAMEPGDEANPLLTGDVTLAALYEIDPLTFGEAAATQLTTKVVDIAVCDAVSCGDCGVPSEGCERIYVLAQSPGAGSPSILPELIYTVNGGTTWYNEYIDTLLATEQPSAIACAGDYLVVISNGSCSLHWATRTDPGTWTEVSTGFVATKGPNAISVVDASHIWIVGDGGYVYSASSVPSGVTVQHAGIATSQNLRAVHALSSQFIVAAGNNNAVIWSDDGGATWTYVPGPAAGVNLLSLWAVSEDQWFVGTDNTTRLYWTKDRGQTWTEITFPDSGSGGDIAKITFTEDPAVGYMAVNLFTPAGRLYRTIDGGASWYRLPEATGTSLTASDQLVAIAACGPNEVWAGGLADNGADGILLHGVGYEA